MSKSLSSSSKKNNFQFTTNTQIKQFLLNMINDKEKPGHTSANTNTNSNAGNKVKISNNININKIVIQQPFSSAIPEKTNKKSSSVSSATQKPKQPDYHGLNSTKSTSNLIKNFNSKTKNRLSSIYLGTQNKARSSSKDSKVFEVTLNYEQHSLAKNNTKNSRIETSKSPGQSNINSSKAKQIVLGKNEISSLNTKLRPGRVNSAVSNTTVPNQKKNPKIIENFSNYSKISYNKENRKNTINSALLYTDMINPTIPEMSLQSSKIAKVNSMVGIRQLSQIAELNNRKHVMSTKVQFVSGDDDDLLMEDY